MGVAIRLLPVIAFLVIVGAVWWFAIRPRRRRKAAPPSNAPAIESLSPASTPATSVRPARAAQTAADDDESSLEHLWGQLCDLLEGKIYTALAIDGRFNHRSGMRFTIFHRDDVYVIVRAETDAHNTVRRFVINRQQPSILFRTEPRVAPVDSKWGIARSLATNVSIYGMQEVKGEAGLAELAFLREEIAAVYRVGDFMN